MADHALREAIATEAARLILRRKVIEYHEARIRASRWMSKRRLSAQEMPTNAEIQAKVEALACLFAEEQAAFERSLHPDEPVDVDLSEDLEETEVADDEYHPDTFPLLRILMNRLDGLRLDTTQHPEGDALYHSLQVYELALAERPWDEEFLLAALIHDVGLGIDRRHPVVATLNTVGHLLTERTCFLIEHWRDGIDYLRTGKTSRSLRKSDHFDDIVLLARFDLQGRVPGAEVGTLDEALEYIASLETAWDEE